MIATPGGKVASNQLIINVPLKLGTKIIKTDLILLALEGVDIILGVDYSLDLSSRAVEIVCSEIEEIPVVREYADVFPDDLPSMPPAQDIEFVIKLQPGTTPISK
jgi:hypothetical protein